MTRVVVKGDITALELFIARFLRYGVLVAGIFMAIGWLSHLSFSQDTFAHFQQYHDVRLWPTLEMRWQNQEWGLLAAYFGMFILISLPLLRVVLTLFVFLKNKDYALAAVSAAVLFGLMAGVVLGFEL